MELLTSCPLLLTDVCLWGIQYAILQFVYLYKKKVPHILQRCNFLLHSRVVAAVIFVHLGALSWCVYLSYCRFLYFFMFYCIIHLGISVVSKWNFPYRMKKVPIKSSSAKFYLSQWDIPLSENPVIIDGGEEIHTESFNYRTHCYTNYLQYIYIPTICASVSDTEIKVKSSNKLINIHNVVMRAHWLAQGHRKVGLDQLQNRMFFYSVFQVNT